MGKLASGSKRFLIFPDNFSLAARLEVISLLISGDNPGNTAILLTLAAWITLCHLLLAKFVFVLISI